MRNRAFLVALTLYLAMTCGCDSLYNREFIEPEPAADVRDLRVLVVPFREGSRWYGESETGKRLAVALERVLSRNCDATFLSSAERHAIIDPILDSTEPTVPWQEIALKANIDAIIVGDVTERSYGQQDIVGIVAGRVSVLIEIWRKDKGLTYSHEITDSYPKDPEHGDIAPSFDQSRGEVEAKLLGLIATEIGDMMCGYEDARKGTRD